MSKELSVRSNWLSASSASNTALALPKPKVSSNFMGRWSLSRLLTPINYADFAGIVQTFHRSVSDAFGTPCDIQIRSYKQAPETITIDDPAREAILDSANQSHLLTDISSLAAYLAKQPQASRQSLDLSRSKNVDNLPVPEKLHMQRVWEQSGYIQVSIKPFNKEEAPQSAWGVVEFKGRFPKHASFYAQPYNEKTPYAEKIASDMRSWGKGLIYREGSRDHTFNVTPAGPFTSGW